MHSISNCSQESQQPDEEKEIIITTIQTVNSFDHLISPSSPAVFLDENKHEVKSLN